MLAHDLGRIAYADALALQRRAAAARVAGELTEDLLLLCEHPPVVTMGRSAKAANLLLSETALAARGIELYEVERGGDVTFHGPGQLVAYPILDLTGHRQDLHWYLRQLEEVVIRAVASVGIVADRNPGKTGVWTDGRKLASIGVHARQWVTWHGVAMNVTTDLRYFDVMVPCGIADVTMTSVQAELTRAGTAPDATALTRQLFEATITAFADAFAVPVLLSPDLPVPLRSAD
ncbi:MAG: lipoyl(octanoyl) transferase LipB [Gemmatimonadaceae bacterium]|nr:lipoyl(octanoyl) transferase LipB [Gemmatimonadaceae bacterium]